MKNVFACGAALSMLATPVAANAAVIITTGATASIPGNNDFQSQLSDLGLTRYTTTGAQLMLDGPATITFEFLGSESAFDDAFTALGLAPLTLSENTPFTDAFAAPIAIGSAVFAAGDLAGRLLFSTGIGGTPATVGQEKFAIFLGHDQASGPVNTFYFGYDDLITGPDDDYDDFIVRATVSAVPVVPEPATWALMIMGFGFVGAALRSANRAKDVRVRFA